MVESCLEGLDGLKFVAYGVDVFFLQHLCVDCAFVCVGGIYVPCSEHDVVELGDGNDFVIFEVFLVCTATHTDLVVLGHRANWLGKALASHQNASHEGRCHCSETYYHHSELALGGLYIVCGHIF